MTRKILPQFIKTKRRTKKKKFTTTTVSESQFSQIKYRCPSLASRLRADTLYKRSPNLTNTIFRQAQNTPVLIFKKVLLICKTIQLHPAKLFMSSPVQGIAVWFILNTLSRLTTSQAFKERWRRVVQEGQAVNIYHLMRSSPRNRTQIASNTSMISEGASELDLMTVKKFGYRLNFK